MTTESSKIFPVNWPSYASYNLSAFYVIFPKQNVRVPFFSSSDNPSANFIPLDVDELLISDCKPDAEFLDSGVVEVSPLREVEYLPKDRSKILFRLNGDGNSDSSDMIFLNGLLNDVYSSIKEDSYDIKFLSRFKMMHNDNPFRVSMFFYYSSGDRDQYELEPGSAVIVNNSTRLSPANGRSDSANLDSIPLQLASERFIRSKADISTLVENKTDRYLLNKYVDDVRKLEITPKNIFDDERNNPVELRPKSVIVGTDTFEELRRAFEKLGGVFADDLEAAADELKFLGVSGSNYEELEVKEFIKQTDALRADLRCPMCLGLEISLGELPKCRLCGYRGTVSDFIPKGLEGEIRRDANGKITSININDDGDISAAIGKLISAEEEGAKPEPKEDRKPKKTKLGKRKLL